MMMVQLQSEGEAECECRIAYLLTHHPRLALTFIAGEIEEIERRGGRVSPIVMNLPDPSELNSSEAQRQADLSLYLKSSPARLLLAPCGILLRHPWQMTRLLITALRSARGDPKLLARRLAHLSYAALTADYSRQRSIRHLHAHFGQSPATIAWFAAEIMNFSGREACSWSFTIHGFQDFVDEAVARLDLKAASAAFVVCVSDFTRSQLYRVADPAHWHRFHVIRCGIDLAAFPLRAPKPLAAVPRILIVGRLSPEKGHLVLLQALRSLSDDNVAAEVEIVGAGPFEQSIRDATAALGLENQVTFAGELAPPQVAERLAAADIFCMASFSEGLPISIMEAMAVGVPVVTTWISGIPELAVNEVTAMTVPPANSAALARAIRQLIEDGARRERVVAAARSAVERAHSRTDNGAQLAALFRQQPALCSESKARHG